MGLVLNPAEIKSGAGQMSACIEGTRRSYSRALETVQSFSENRELESESWDKMKGDAFIAHQSIVMGMAAVQDVMVQGLGQLVACAGEEYLDEDELASKIQSLTQECIMYEEIIKRLLIMQSTTILQGNPIIAKMIAYNRSMLNKTKMILEIMKIKLESLRDKAEMTATLFQDVGPLLQAIESAINDAEYYISGTGTLSDGSWKITIAESIKEVNENLGEWYVERALQKELGIDSNSLKEMYGEDIIARIKETITESDIASLDKDNQEGIVKSAIKSITGYDVMTVDDTYYYKDIDGSYKKLTTEKALSIFQRQADIDDLIKVASSQVGQREVNEDNKIKYNDWYYGGRDRYDSGAAWCSVFVMWSMNEVGLLDGKCLPEYEKIKVTKKNFSKVINVANWYKEDGRYIDAKTGYEPKEGDLFFHFYDDGETGHTGIVVAFDKEKNIIYTVEGNSGNEVATNVRDYNSYFNGFGSNGGNVFGVIPERYGKADARDR